MDQSNEQEKRLSGGNVSTVYKKGITSIALKRKAASVFIDGYVTWRQSNFPECRILLESMIEEEKC
ncbi:MAG: hypothetical protein IKG65_14020 [Exiguobacterium sp.]|uniref:hypothetical protein n=1 Tax=unclassified Exiguobacterium TaxID=2644629 RepID=UPI00333530D5|nr:hypothetical protein [Exiguobacterium sp.]